MQPVISSQAFIKPQSTLYANKDEILQRFPQTTKDTSLHVLSEMRIEFCPEPKQKRKRVNIKSEKSIRHEDIVGEICSDEKNEPPDDEIENMIRHDEDNTVKCESEYEPELDGV